jgi:GNAT superfamily N-acetyltransferase
MAAPRLRDLTEDERARYFRGVQPLWGGGLPEEQFVTYQLRLANAPESAGRYRALGLVDERGVLLSAMKAYLLGGELLRRPLRVLGIGAVWTPPSLRRRGHAGRMLEQALQLHAALGCEAALLFTDIGTAYYQRLGFHPVESGECLVDLRQLPKGAGFRPAGPGDDEQLTRILARGRSQEAGFTLARDGWSLRFQLRRLRELARIRQVGEPEWGVLASDPAGGQAAAMIRHTRDAVDVLDAAWTTAQAREALLAGLRDCLVRSGRPGLRVWPAHQLRGLWEARPRGTALAMIAPLGQGFSPAQASRVDLTLLDHI